MAEISVPSAADLQAVKQDYLECLKELNFPARPVIQNLTTIAQENIYVAPSIVEAVEEQIAKAPPQHKLPALYLLDSICKNIGNPYTKLFSRNLYDTFINAYTAIEPNNRKKFEEMFETWKVPLRDGDSTQPVFSPEATDKIEMTLQRIRLTMLKLQQDQHRRQFSYSAYSQHALPNLQPPGYMTNAYTSITPPTINSRQGLLSQVDELIVDCQKLLVFNLSNEAARKRIGYLDQLREILLGSILPESQLYQIRYQLSTLITNSSKWPISNQLPTNIVNNFSIAGNNLDQSMQKSFTTSIPPNLLALISA